MCSSIIETQQAVLCVDIGSRTQDALIFTPGDDPDDAARFVLPAPAHALARKIRALTDKRRDMYLRGGITSSEIQNAIQAHIDAGCSLAMTPEVEPMLQKRPGLLASRGVTVTEIPPDGYAVLDCLDIDLDFWRNICAASGLEMPPLVAVAAQDHGLAPDGCAYGSRMTMWRDIFSKREDSGGISPKNLLYRTPPPYLARLAAIQAITKGPVADSGAAALLGLLSVPEIAERSMRQGIVLVNGGNSHNVAFLVYRERIFGVYEQHTFKVSTEHMVNDLAEFRLGWLPDEKVRQEGGHGVLLLELPPEAEGFAPTYITGPQRHILAGYGQMSAAHDDAHTNGCFGLLHALSAFNEPDEFF